MTGPRSARSAGSSVGSIPSMVVKVQSAGQTLSRLLANWRCQRLRRFLCEASGAVAGGLGLDRLNLGLGVAGGRGVRAGRCAGGEYLVGEWRAPFAEGLLLGQPVGVAAEVALQVRPAPWRWVGSRWL